MVADLDWCAAPFSKPLLPRGRRLSCRRQHVLRRPAPQLISQSLRQGTSSTALKAVFTSPPLLSIKLSTLRPSRRYRVPASMIKQGASRRRRSLIYIARPLGLIIRQDALIYPRGMWGEKDQGHVREHNPHHLLGQPNPRLQHRT